MGNDLYGLVGRICLKSTWALTAQNYLNRQSSDYMK